MTTDAKRIQFNATDKDYSAYYDDELIGIFATYHAAEIELDAHALDLLERGLVDAAEDITTMQWQQPRTAYLDQRLADEANGFFFDNAPTAEPPRSFTAECAICGECKDEDQFEDLDDETPICFDCRATIIEDQIAVERAVAWFRPAEAPELLYTGPADEPPPDGPGEDSPGPNDPTGPHVEMALMLQASQLCTRICVAMQDTKGQHLLDLATAYQRAIVRWRRRVDALPHTTPAEF